MLVLGFCCQESGHLEEYFQKADVCVSGVCVPLALACSLVGGLLKALPGTAHGPSPRDVSAKNLRFPLFLHLHVFLFLFL